MKLFEDVLLYLKNVAFTCLLRCLAWYAPLHQLLQLYALSYLAACDAQRRPVTSPGTSRR